MKIKKLEAIIDALFQEKKEGWHLKEEIEIIDDKIIDLELFYKKITGSFYSPNLSYRKV